jgi:hypothetical protein
MTFLIMIRLRPLKPQAALWMHIALRFQAAILLFFTSLSASEAKPMHFSEGYSGGNCGRGLCAWIAAEGEIEPDTTKKLQTFLRSWDVPLEGTWVTFNSPGGSLSGGLALGRFLRSHGINTRVGATGEEKMEDAGRTYSTLSAGICASACTIAFMGGVERETIEGSRIGIHQFNVSGTKNVDERVAFSTAQELVSELSVYARAMGVSPDIVTAASRIRSSDILWLTQDDLETSNLVTSRRRPAEVDWQLRPFDGKLVAIADQSQDQRIAVTFAITCAGARDLALVAYLPRSSSFGGDSRLAEVAASLSTAELEPEDFQSSSTRIGPLAIAAKADQNGVLVSLPIGLNQLQTLATASERYVLSLDAPHAYWEDLLGARLLLPRSNLREVLPHVVRSCGG